MQSVKKEVVFKGAIIRAQSLLIVYAFLPSAIILMRRNENWNWIKKNAPLLTTLIVGKKWIKEMEELYETPELFTPEERVMAFLFYFYKKYDNK